MEKEKIKQIIAKYYGSVPTSNLRIESLRLAKDIVCSQIRQSINRPTGIITSSKFEFVPFEKMPKDIKDQDDKILDRILYIAFRIEEYVNNN